MVEQKTNRALVNRLAQALTEYINERPTPASERFLIEKLRYRYGVGRKSLKRAIRLLNEAEAGERYA